MNRILWLVFASFLFAMTVGCGGGDKTVLPTKTYDPPEKKGKGMGI